ncbi:hypothetical protein [Streptomyces xanthochromogenes]|uniref:hypothetical protein n=1 Tax=Streptomyces xanthochromogenes TaxID=67384 RepID=UPI0034153407
MVRLSLAVVTAVAALAAATLLPSAAVGTVAAAPGRFGGHDERLLESQDRIGARHLQVPRS